MIGAIIGGATGLIQAGAGAIQTHKANKALKKLSRPTYEIPDEVLKNVSQAERMALQGMPEDQKMQYVERMQQSQAGQLSQMKTLGAGLRGMAGIQQEQKEMNKNLLSMDAQARMQNMLQATHQRSILSDKKDEQWSINEYQPYMQKKNALEAQKGAGIQNMFGGLSTVGQAAMNAFSLGGGGGSNSSSQGQLPSTANAIQNTDRPMTRSIAPLTTAPIPTRGLAGGTPSGGGIGAGSGGANFSQGSGMFMSQPQTIPSINPSLNYPSPPSQPVNSYGFLGGLGGFTPNTY